MINKALVVNDDATLLMLACKIINKAGFAHETVTADNGEHALAYFEDILLLGKDHFDKVPAFIFLDLNMPVMSGWEFLEIFSKKYADIFPAIRIAVLSASVDENEISQLKNYSVVSDFISTPINIEKVKNVREKFLGGIA